MNIENLQSTFQSKGYSVSYFQTGEEAGRYLSNSIRGKTVGFGDSATLLDIDAYHWLRDHNTVYDPQHLQKDETFLAVAKDCLTTEIFLTSVNAVAETGELVNIDGTGNRIAGSLFGHETVYFVVGTNKVCPHLDGAIHRARHTAAPQNAKRLGYQTPCAKDGDQCYDCHSPQRICNSMVIHFRKMDDMAMEIIFIGEPLGL